MLIPPAVFFLINDTVQREYVNPQTRWLSSPRTLGLVTGPVTFNHSGKRCKSRLIIPIIDKSQFVGIVLFAEAFIVRTGHHNIHVVIPRDETFVTKSPYKSPVCDGIPYSSFGTKGMNILEDIKTDLLKLLQCQFLYFAHIRLYNLPNAVSEPFLCLVVRIKIHDR